MDSSSLVDVMKRFVIGLERTTESNMLHLSAIFNGSKRFIETLSTIFVLLLVAALLAQVVGGATGSVLPFLDC